VTDLDLSYCNLGDTAFASLCLGDYLSSLKSLNLRWSKINDTNLRILLAPSSSAATTALGDNPSSGIDSMEGLTPPKRGLVTINLSDCLRLTEAAIDILVSTGHCTTLKTVILRGASACVTNKALEKIAARFYRLEKLDISNCHEISNLSPLTHKEASSHYRRTGSVSQAGAPTISSTSALPDSSTGSRDSVRFPFASKRKTKPFSQGATFTSRQPPSHVLQSKAFRASTFSGSTLACPRLKELNIDACPKLEGRGIEVAGVGIGRTAITSVSFCQPEETNLVLQAFAVNCPELRHVFVQRSEDIVDDSVLCLAKNCPKLERLMLQNCSLITKEAITTLVSMCYGLKHLDLNANNNVTDEVYIYFFFIIFSRVFAKHYFVRV